MDVEPWNWTQRETPALWWRDSKTKANLRTQNCLVSFNRKTKWPVKGEDNIRGPANFLPPSRYRGPISFPFARLIGQFRRIKIGRELEFPLLLLGEEIYHGKKIFRLRNEVEGGDSWSRDTRKWNGNGNRVRGFVSFRIEIENLVEYQWNYLSEVRARTNVFVDRRSLRGKMRRKWRLRKWIFLE